MLIIHRDIREKEHEQSEDCWCDPMIVQDDDLRTTEQLLAESNRRDLKH